MPIAFLAVSTIPYLPSRMPAASQRYSYEPVAFCSMNSVVTGAPTASTSVAVTSEGSRSR